MDRPRLPTLLLALLASLAFPMAAAAAPDPFVVADQTTAYAFVTRYIGDLAEQEQLRAQAQTALAGHPDQKGDQCARTANAFQERLSAQAGRLQRMTLLDSSSALSNLPTKIAELYRDKSELYQRMSQACGTLVGGAKPGVDYTRIATEITQLSTAIDGIDQSLTRIGLSVFSTLVAAPADAARPSRRLSITAAQKQALLALLDHDFGASLQAADQSPLVSQAGVLYDGLKLEKFRCADQPGD